MLYRLAKVQPSAPHMMNAASRRLLFWLRLLRSSRRSEGRSAVWGIELTDVVVQPLVALVPLTVVNEEEHGDSRTSRDGEADGAGYPLPADVAWSLLFISTMVRLCGRRASWPPVTCG